MAELTARSFLFRKQRCCPWAPELLLFSRCKTARVSAELLPTACASSPSCASTTPVTHSSSRAARPLSLCAGSAGRILCQPREGSGCWQAAVVRRRAAKTQPRLMLRPRKGQKYKPARADGCDEWACLFIRLETHPPGLVRMHMHVVCAEIHI